MFQTLAGMVLRTAHTFTLPAIEFHRSLTPCHQQYFSLRQQIWLATMFRSAITVVLLRKRFSSVGLSPAATMHHPIPELLNWTFPVMSITV